MIVGITGHRPDKLGGHDNYPVHDYIRSQFHDLFKLNKVKKIITGMAQGVDTLAFEAALYCTGIEVVAALPFEGQEKMWPDKAQKYYHELLKKATEVVYVSGPGYAPWKMQLRNRYIVDNCTLLAAVWDGSDGGTANCVDYAAMVGRQIKRIELPPLDIGDLPF